MLRPASYCGVTGFKASYGVLPMDGVFPFAKSLDTLGFFTHTADDMLALWESMGYSTGRAEDFALAAPDPVPDVEPPMAAAFQQALARVRNARISRTWFGKASRSRWNATTRTDVSSPSARTA
jgi:Asp-tRNA(Asn)/Glu-tRNA(Gln) amidotransferase A subunit family amidase